MNSGTTANLRKTSLGCMCCYTLPAFPPPPLELAAVEEKGFDGKPGLKSYQEGNLWLILLFFIICFMLCVLELNTSLRDFCLFFF